MGSGLMRLGVLDKLSVGEIGGEEIVGVGGGLVGT
jgi:hypothetical protein